MDKVESLSLNLRHFLVFNSEKAQTQQSLLASIERCINDLTHKTEIIEESIRKIEDHVVVCKSPLPHKTQKNNSLFTDTLASPYLMCII